jgi:hypothetical protein
MDPEEKEDNSKKFENVIDALHNKSKLPSLRTYQGDMAEFIKEKNESTISIALKEKEKKDEEKKEEEFSLPKKSASKKEGFQINLTIIILSLLLIGGGVLASFYIFQFLKEEPVNEVVLKEEIIPYNNSITLANVTSADLGSELGKLSPANGISVIKISGIDGLPIQKAKDFFAFLKISLPPALERTLKDQYLVGVISQNKENSYFVVITVNDFGKSFSSMLDWEASMVKDLSFLNVETNMATIASTTATTTIPIKQESFIWKDIIIKNKDTRGLVNEKDKSKIAYTFLDKNTILITGNLSAIGEISSVYASRSVAR